MRLPNSRLQGTSSTTLIRDVRQLENRMSTKCDILVGNVGGEHVQISLLSRSHSGHDDYWDGNWIASEVELRAGAYRASFRSDFRSEDFVSFHKSVCQLSETLRGSAKFDTIEGQLALKLISDGLGHIRVEGTSLDVAGVGNRLNFHFDIDQTYLAGIVRSLEKSINTYPVVGRP
jgi:hypothetical protein